jgi:hypothetical protein
MHTMPEADIVIACLPNGSTIATVKGAGLWERWCHGEGDRLSTLGCVVVPTLDEARRLKALDPDPFVAQVGRRG